MPGGGRGELLGFPYSTITPVKFFFSNLIFCDSKVEAGQVDLQAPHRRRQPTYPAATEESHFPVVSEVESRFPSLPAKFSLAV